MARIRLHGFHSGSGSQIGQDAWVESLHPEPGYFVELGAGDGVRLSNTLVLERRGWSGLCIEPTADFEELVNNRRCHVRQALAGATTGERFTFLVDSDDPHYSGISGARGLHADRHNVEEVEMTTVTLTEILDSVDAPPIIDYLSLDTEGTEAAVLAGLDPTKYTLRFATVEHNWEKGKRRAIQRWMHDAGLKRVRRRLFDDWYVNPSLLGRKTVLYEYGWDATFQGERVARKLFRRSWGRQQQSELT